MREELKKRDGERDRFSGRLKRFGRKTSWKGWPIKTALLVEVKDKMGKQVCDHLWFTVGKQIEALNLAPGDVITFTARVAPYVKGYRGHRPEVEGPPVEQDYRLINPRDIRKAGDTCQTFNSAMLLWSPEQLAGSETIGDAAPSSVSSSRTGRAKSPTPSAGTADEAF